jgi:phenylacetate-CoA ligase
MNTSHSFGNQDAARREYDYARRCVPFYRSRGDADVAGEFARVPFTSKIDYRSHFPNGILADGYTPTHAHVRRLQSAGTESERLVTAHHEFLLAERMWSCLKVNKRLSPLLAARSIRPCRYAAPNCSDVECSNPNATVSDRMLPDGTLVLPVHHDLLTTPEGMIRSALRELREFAPNMIYADPFHLAFLSRAARRLGVAVEPPLEATIVLSFSLLTRTALRDIRAGFGADRPLAVAVAMSEFGYVGMECDHGTMHLNDVNFFLEFLSDNQLSVDGHPLFELTLTSIGDRICPHVRYRTGDLYRLVESCECGSRMPGVIVEGRKKDTITLPDGRKVTPRRLDQVIGAPAWLDTYQLTIQPDHEFVCRFIDESAQAEAAAVIDLQQRLQELLQSSRVRVESTSYFPSARGGKLQAIRSAS